MSRRRPAPSGSRRTGGARRAIGTFRAVALLAALFAAVSVCLAGCGIPTESAARSISADQLPFNLLTRVPPQTTPTTQSGYVQVNVYLTFDDQGLVSVPRYVAPSASATPTESLTAVVNVMLKGPTTTELQNGIHTAINPNVKLLTTHVVSDTATLNFSGAFGQISGTQQVLAVAQVVYTVTGPLGDGVGVNFEITGFPIEVPIGTGGLVSGPVHVTQYCSLIAQTATAASVATTPTTSPACAASAGSTATPATTAPTGA